ncbi:MAG: Spy/CpxP family protein refolding chaperone [Candidatus Omnitrophota bacterium]
MKKLGVLTLLVVLAVCFSVPAGYADYGKKYCKKTKHYDGLKEKFFYKAHFILNNEDELGLSEKQVDLIRDLKVKTKKDLINKQAQIDLLGVDIKTMMWEDPMDLDTINGLIERKFAIKEEKTKNLVNAYAKLKGILSEEQKTKLKKLWLQKSYVGRH